MLILEMNLELFCDQTRHTERPSLCCREILKFALNVMLENHDCIKKVLLQLFENRITFLKFDTRISSLVI